MRGARGLVVGWFVTLACAPVDVAPPPSVGDPADDSDAAAAVDTDGAGDDTDRTEGPLDPLDRCGDGVRDPEEACDDGAANGATPCGCTTACALPAEGAACDDGDGCTVNDACDGLGACGAAPRDCDDHDACTADRCDQGACQHEAWSGDPLDLFDMTSLRDPSTLNVQVLDTETVWEGLTPVRVQTLRYTSFQSDACVVSPVQLEAFLAVPVADVGRLGALPGLVVAHGLGGWAEAGHASSPAAQLGAAVLAYSGPGQGLSEGTGSVPDHLFDVDDIPSDCWFWEHEVAAIRGLSVLQATPEVDDGRLAMSGYSGGAVATLVVNGVDDRLSAAFAASGTGWLDLAARNPTPGWEVDLLASMAPPRGVNDAAWTRWEASMDPRHFLATAHAPAFLADGAQDEFFPVDSLVASMRDLGPAHRVLSVVNWDHGWFALFNGDEAAVRVDAAFEDWMRHHLGLGATWADPLPQPVLSGVVLGLCDGWPCAMAVVNTPPHGLREERAWIHISTDGLAYATFELEKGPLGWTGGMPLSDPATLNTGTAVWIGEVELRRGRFGPTVRVTTVPSLPPGFQPQILPIAGPLPL